jgi:hypothetical protein
MAESSLTWFRVRRGWADQRSTRRAGKSAPGSTSDTQTIYERRENVIVVGPQARSGRVPRGAQGKAARRQLSPKLFKAGDPKTIGKGRGQIEVQLNAGITDDIARDLRKRIQNVSPKVQVRIQGDQLRVVGKDKDTLQLVIKALREAEDIPVPLQFTNYRAARPTRLSFNIGTVLVIPAIDILGGLRPQERLQQSDLLDDPASQADFSAGVGSTWST